MTASTSAAEPAERAGQGVVLDQAIDTTTPSGRLLFHVLASISEFERDLIRDRVLAGLKRAKAQGVRLGRPRAVVDVLRARAMLAEGKSPPAGGQGPPRGVGDSGARRAENLHARHLARCPPNGRCLRLPAMRKKDFFLRRPRQSRGPDGPTISTLEGEKL